MDKISSFRRVSARKVGTRKSTVLVSTVLVSTVFVLLCVAAQAAPFRGKGFTLEVPRGWNVQPKSPKFLSAEVVILGPKNGANINVVTSRARLGQTLEAGAQETHSELRKLKGFKSFGHRIIVFKGARALADEYAYDSPHNGRLRVRQILAIRGPKVYALTAMSREKTWPRLWPAFKATFASFRWIK